MKSALAKRVSSIAVVAAVGAGAAGSAVAQSASPAQALLDQSFVFNLGAFVVQSDLKGNLNGRSVERPEVDFDNTFGKANDATRVRGDAMWRITPTHHLSLMYFDNRVSRTKVLDKDLVWGDNTYHAGGSATSDNDFKVSALVYEYAFMRQPGYEVAASIGVHYTRIGLKISGAASVTNPDGTVASLPLTTQSESVPAPLPVVGLRGAWVVAPQLLVDVKGQFFKMNSSGIGGNWTDFQANATWMFSKNFGAGLGYNRYMNRLDVNKDSYNGQVKMGYSGLQAYLTGSF